MAEPRFGITDNQVAEAEQALDAARDERDRARLGVACA